jgi:hypothetical protein
MLAIPPETPVVTPPEPAVETQAAIPDAVAPTEGAKATAGRGPSRADPRRRLGHHRRRPDAGTAACRQHAAQRRTDEQPAGPLAQPAQAVGGSRRVGGRGLNRHDTGCFLG